MVRICESGVFLENLRYPHTRTSGSSSARPVSGHGDADVSTRHVRPLWVHTSLRWDVAHDNGEGELNGTDWASGQAAVELGDISIHLQLPR